MTKVQIRRLDSVTENDTAATLNINNNFEAIQQAIENTLSRDGTTPNFMDANLDMNSYKIINAGKAVDDNDLVNYKQFKDEIGAGQEAAAQAAASAAQAASSAQSALVSSTNAITAVRNAENILTATSELLEETHEYVDNAKIDIDNTKQEAINAVEAAVADLDETVRTSQQHIEGVRDEAVDTVTGIRDGAIVTISQTVADGQEAIENIVAEGERTIQSYVDGAEDEVRQIARTEAQEAIADAKQDVQDYADTTIKPSLQTYVDSAAASEQVATQSADNAVESATQAAASASQALSSATTAEEWARYAEGKGHPNWGYIGGDIEDQADLMMKFDAVDDKIKEIELFKFPNADIIGEPIIQSGQVSGFSTVSYLQFPFIMDLRGNPFQIDFSFTTAVNVQTQQNILDSKFGLAIAIKDGKGLMAISSNGTSWNIGQAIGTMNIESNTTYYARVTWDGMQYKTFLSTNGTDYVQDMTLVGTQAPFPRTMFIGGCDQLVTGHEPHPFLGSINLNKAYLSIRGSVVWQGMDDAGLATRADVSLSNLDSEGQAKFDAKLDKSTITNCITEIPQDIKLELNNGTLTLKAGSKVYVPNGFESDGVTPKFDEVVIESDMSTSLSLTSKSLIRHTNNNINTLTVENFFSGSTAPNNYNIMVWYDTANNIIKYTTDKGVTWEEKGDSLVLGEMTSASSIDQVFNGFGYIGSTVFALPGVKGLIPNGRNADGSLKNIETSVSSVSLLTLQSSITLNGNGRFLLDASGNISARVGSYDEKNNYVLAGDGINKLDRCVFADNCTVTSGVINIFNPKTAFHAIDYNDFNSLSNAVIDNKHQVVSAKPSVPTTGVFYYVRE